MNIKYTIFWVMKQFAFIWLPQTPKGALTLSHVSTFINFMFNIRYSQSPFRGLGRRVQTEALLF